MTLQPLCLAQGSPSEIRTHPRTQAPTNTPVAQASISLSHPSQDFPSQNPCLSLNAAADRELTTSQQWDLICRGKLGHWGVSSGTRDGESRSNGDAQKTRPALYPPLLHPVFHQSKPKSHTHRLAFHTSPCHILYCNSCTHFQKKSTTTKTTTTNKSKQQIAFFRSADSMEICL